MADRPRHDRSAPTRSGRLRSGVLARFARAQDGAAAVEFAFVAIPFLLLVFAIIELGLVFLVSMTLENALNTVDRRIRTGDIQNSSGTAASFRTAVCNEMSWLASACPNAITLDVRSMDSFADTGSLTAPAANKTCWDPGGPSSIILVRGYYKWPVITPLMQGTVAGSTGDRKIGFAAVFANEPYEPTKTVASVTCPT